VSALASAPLCGSSIELRRLGPEFADYADALLADFGMRNIQGHAVCATDGRSLLGVGAIVYKDETQSAWLNCVAVRKGYHRRGLGTRIVQWCVDNSRPHDVWLETMFWNRRFYESLGFAHVPVGEARALFGNEVRRRRNTMLMRKLR
jgi:N-acetylglutamate synthase-like GNAT family acetyltransferase